MPINLRSLTTKVLLLFTAIILSVNVSQAQTNSKSKLTYIDIDSPSLISKQKVKAGVYLPAGYDQKARRFPVIYYFAGFGQDETGWEKMGVKDILDDLIARKIVSPMIVISPGSNDTGWVNWYNGEYQWEDFIKRDLVRAVDQRYRTINESCARAIAGNSMGGSGALVIGFKNRNIFGSISSHSAAVQPEDPSKLPGWAKNWEGWIPRNGKPIDVYFWKANNSLALAEMFNNSNRDNKLIYFDVGEKDHLGFAKTNAALSKRLKDLEIEHEFHLRAGGHGSKFVKDNAHYSLKFHSNAFRQKCKRG
ncbi:MAG: hypothetical protein HKN25_18550 [Pyrinomonadaceae bacterium]|nr:hypothetical protein [Pyrinomonadaceae bacterium]